VAADANGLVKHLTTLFNSKLVDGASKTITKVNADGSTSQTVETRNADGSVTEGLSVAPASGVSDFVPIWVGTAAEITSGPVSTLDVRASLDFDAWQSVEPSEPQSGQLAISESALTDPTEFPPGIKDTLSINFTNWMPNPGDPHGVRNGAYLSVGEPGLGGTLDYQDSLILPGGCLHPDLFSSTTQVKRTFGGSDGSLYSRLDTETTGGSLASGDSIQQFQCSAAPIMPYKMIKLEDDSGNTVQGTQSSAGSSACNPAFGPVPSLGDDATDYNFGSPISFPGEW
jgi:hypothetical protein